MLPPKKKIASRGMSVMLKTARGRTTASQKWLSRQLNDPYVRAAKEQGLRSRAAFKLMELDDRFHLIAKGARVIDLGAAPGGWAQVAVQRGAARVVGVDLMRIMGLADLALHFAFDALEEGGTFVAKVFQGGSERTMLEKLKRHFATVRHAKPPASRKESSELYVVATGYRSG